MQVNSETTTIDQVLVQQFCVQEQQIYNVKTADRAIQYQSKLFDCQQTIFSRLENQIRMLK